MDDNKIIENFVFDKVLVDAMEIHEVKINLRKREEVLFFEVPEHHTPFKDMKHFI